MLVYECEALRLYGFAFLSSLLICAGCKAWSYMFLVSLASTHSFFIICWNVLDGLQKSRTRTQTENRNTAEKLNSMSSGNTPVIIQSSQTLTFTGWRRMWQLEELRKEKQIELRQRQIYCWSHSSFLKWWTYVCSNKMVVIGGFTRVWNKAVQFSHPVQLWQLWYMNLCSWQTAKHPDRAKLSEANRLMSLTDRDSFFTLLEKLLELVELDSKLAISSPATAVHQHEEVTKTLEPFLLRHRHDMLAVRG